MNNELTDFAEFVDSFMWTFKSNFDVINSKFKKFLETKGHILIERGVKKDKTFRRSYKMFYEHEMLFLMLVYFLKNGIDIDSVDSLGMDTIEDAFYYAHNEMGGFYLHTLYVGKIRMIVTCGGNVVNVYFSLPQNGREIYYSCFNMIETARTYYDPMRLFGSIRSSMLAYNLVYLFLAQIEAYRDILDCFDKIGKAVVHITNKLYEVVSGE